MAAVPDGRCERQRSYPVHATAFWRTMAETRGGEDDGQNRGRRVKKERGFGLVAGAFRLPTSSDHPEGHTGRGTGAHG